MKTVKEVSKLTGVSVRALHHIIMVINLLNANFSTYKHLPPADLVAVIAITAIIFLIKTGVFSALLIGIKKLCERLRCK